MQVVHETGGGECVLASDVELAETTGEQMKGLMFRDSLPADFAMLFRFDDPPRWKPGFVPDYRSINMLFMKVPIYVLWLQDGHVQQVSTLSPWTGFGMARADAVVEMPAGAADGVAAGDTVRIVESDD